MAVITPDTFDPLKRFVSVRLQQGVPVVDADFNEGDDARRFEMRSYMRWFVGDGVPYGSDAFRIQALVAPAANDFVIRRGVAAAPMGSTPLATGLHHLGRCLVDGLEATIEDDVDFRAQELHVANAGAAAAGIRLGSLTIPELPVLTGNVLIYLDVWERIARPDEFPGLVFVDIGTETCARIRREWAVRARLPNVVPQDGDMDFEDGHSYFPLASIARVAGDPIVFPSQITDLREQKLLMPPATLIEDLLGAPPDRYRQGLDRPAIPLRTAINALLKGQLPSTADQVIAPDPANDFGTRSVARDGDDIYFIWPSNRVVPNIQLFAASWKASDPPSAALNPPAQVTNGAANSELASLVLLPTTPTPAVFVAYQTQGNIKFRHAAAPAGLPAAPETAVTSQADPEGHALAVRTGTIVTVFWHYNGPGANDRIRYRRRQYNAVFAEPGNWLEGETTDLSTLQARLPSTTPGIMHAAADATDRIWLAFETVTDHIAVARLTPGTGALETFTNLELNAGSPNQQQPFVIVDDAGGHVFVFWRADDGIHQAVHTMAGAVWSAATLVPGTSGPAGTNTRPVAVRDSDGGIWLLWSRVENGQTNIWAARRDPGTGGWGLARQITASAGNNDFAFATMQQGSIQLFFRSNRTGEFGLYTKQIVTTV